MVTRDSVASWIGNHSNYKGGSIGLGIRCESALVPKKAVPIAVSDASLRGLQDELRIATEAARAGRSSCKRRKRGRGATTVARDAKRRVGARDRNRGVDDRIDRDAEARRAAKRTPRRVAASLRAKAALYDALVRGDGGSAVTPEDCMVNFAAKPPISATASALAEAAPPVPATATRVQQARREARHPSPPLPQPRERVAAGGAAADDSGSDAEMCTRTDEYGRVRRFSRGSADLRRFDAERRGDLRESAPRRCAAPRDGDGRRRRGEGEGGEAPRRAHGRVAGGVRQRYEMTLGSDQRLVAAAIALETRRARAQHAASTRVVHAAAASDAAADAAAARAGAQREAAADALVASIMGCGVESEGFGDGACDGAALLPTADAAAEALLASLGGHTLRTRAYGKRIIDIEEK